MGQWHHALPPPDLRLPRSSAIRYPAACLPELLARTGRACAAGSVIRQPVYHYLLAGTHGPMAPRLAAPGSSALTDSLFARTCLREPVGHAPQGGSTGRSAPPPSWPPRAAAAAAPTARSSPVSRQHAIYPAAIYPAACLSLLLAGTHGPMTPRLAAPRPSVIL